MDGPVKLNWLNERNCVLLLIALFIIMSISVALVPYDPAADLADATTNDIWIEYYGEGTYHIPYDNWTYPPTQSVVVEYDGQYVVVNEKGPGHVMAMLPFRAVGMEFLFGPFMAGLALVGSYMLGKRLLGWHAGFIAGLLVMVNLTVVVMWHRYYWTDASTMHLLVFSVWLFVEGVYRYNGRSLNPRSENDVTGREKILAIGLLAFSGLAFGASVSTRYPTGLLVVIFPVYVIGFYLIRAWPDILTKQIKKALKESLPVICMLGAFAIGLLVVMIPLMNYNAAYFGGPLNSGYDATSLMEFNRTGTIDVRNTTSIWVENIGSDVSTAFSNLGKLMPTFLVRLPVLAFMPVGMYCMRKKKLELAILLAWASINAFTYLSLEWVDMYARSDLMPWEPRYWMPSFPAIAIIGGFGILGISEWLANRMLDRKIMKVHEKRAFKVLVCGAIVGMLVLGSAVPAASYLRDPPPATGRPPLPQPQAITVTTDQLLSNPLSYVGRAVVINDAEVTGKSFSMMDIRSVGSLGEYPIAVRFMDYPPGTLPVFPVGQHVTVRGVFIKAPTPTDAPPIYYLGVKYGTLDYARLIP